MIEIVKDIEEANYITHSGTMHADEVFATAFLSLYKKDIKLYRASEINPDNFGEDVIIYDIGRGKFDHHQTDRKLRENDIPYCSLGLLWKEFGKDFLKNIGISEVEEVFQGIDKDLIEGIDAIDNGIFPKVEADYKIRNICDIIKLFNPSYGSSEEENTQFLKAVDVAIKIFEEEILYINGKVKAKKNLVGKIEEAIKKHYLILDEFMPYEETIYTLDTNKEIYFVIYPSNRGGYAAKTVYKSPEEKIERIKFKEEWAGLGEELSKVTGVEGATFCHLGRFLVCAKTKEAILKLVELSLPKEENNQEVI